MSDRIAVMNKGHYEQLGDPETLYERPTTRFVAGFLGISNLLGGKVAGAADGYALLDLADGTRIRVSAALVAGRSAVSAGVRPEKIRLNEETETVPAGRNLLHGVVTDVAYIGVSTQYIVEVRGGARVMVYEQNLERATKSELWSRGEKVQLSWNPDHTFVVEASPADAPNDDAAE